MGAAATEAGRYAQRDRQLLLQSYLRVVEEYRTGRVDVATEAISGWPQERVLSVIATLRDIRRRLPSFGYEPAVFGWSVRSVSIATLFHIELAADRSEPLYRRDFHLSAARHLLRLLMQGGAPPEGEQLAIAVSALLQLELKFDVLTEHLQYAARVFPESAAIALALGSAYELRASQRLAAAREHRLVSSDVTDAAVRAEAAYRKAAALDPTLAEPHLRLGHLLYRRARYAEAKQELESAAASTLSRDERYLRELFSGAIEQAMNNWHAAVERYRHATAVCSDCQVAQLALARAYMTVAEPELARAALQRSMQCSSPHYQDPWTRYDYAQGYRFAPIVAALKAQLCGVD